MTSVLNMGLDVLQYDILFEYIYMCVIMLSDWILIPCNIIHDQNDYPCV